MAEFEEAFDELYRLAYQVAFRLTGSRDESKDAAQEALARAYVRWGRVGPYAEAWVSKVSANLVLDGWRRSRRPRGLPEVSPAPTDALAADRLDLLRALSTLPRRQREVLALRYLADLPLANVADALGCTVGTVKQHAARGLEALRHSPDVTPQEA